MPSYENFSFHFVIIGSRYAPVNGPRYEIVAAERKTFPMSSLSSCAMFSICSFHLIPSSSSKTVNFYALTKRLLVRIISSSNFFFKASVSSHSFCNFCTFSLILFNSSCFTFSYLFFTSSLAVNSATFRFLGSTYFEIRA